MEESIRGTHFSGQEVLATLLDPVFGGAKRQFF